MVNVTAIRRFGTRVFRASPIHHHFEELGLRERRLVAGLQVKAVADHVVRLGCITDQCQLIPLAMKEGCKRVSQLAQ